jgi:hypothetical protein
VAIPMTISRRKKLGSLSEATRIAGGNYGEKSVYLL